MVEDEEIIKFLKGVAKTCGVSIVNLIVSIVLVWSLNKLALYTIPVTLGSVIAVFVLINCYRWIFRRS